jgi:Icc-related predicted phosphoesterase
LSMRVYYATDIHGSEVCWRKFLNAGRFYNADVVILGGDITGKAVVPVVAAAGGGYRVRQFSGERVLDADELIGAETRIRDMGFYPYRTTEDELDAVWDNPEMVNEIFLGLMRSTLVRWLDLAAERLAGTGIRLYAMEGNDDPPELYGMLRDTNVLTETEDKLVDLGEGITMISYGYSNPTPWHTPRELDDDELERRIDKLAAQVSRPERAIFNLHVPPAHTAIDMQSVGSEGVRRLLAKHEPMLGLHGHIHESRGAVRLGRTLAVNPGSEYGDGMLCGALLEIDGKRGVRHYQLPTG